MRTRLILLQAIPLFTIFLGYFSLLVFADFSIIHSFTLSTYLFAVSFCGMFVFRAISNRNEFNQFELVGVGIACGTLIPAFIGFVMRSFLGIPSMFGVIVFIILAAILISRYPSTSSPLNNSHLIWCSAAMLFGASSAVAQFVNVYYLVAVEILIFIFIYSKFSDYFITFKTNLSVWTLLLLLILISSRISFVKNQSPIWRQILYVDQIFDTAQSWSVAKYGITDNVFAAHSKMPGHTLTHAWAGISQSILHTPTFMTSGLAGILLGALGSTALIMGFAYRVNPKLSSVLGSTFIWVYQSSFVDQFYASPNPRISNSVSLFWFTFAIFILLENRNKNLKYPLVIIPVILALIGLGKLHWSVYLISTSGIVALIGFLINPRSKQNQKLLVSISLGGLLLIVFYTQLMHGMNAHTEPRYVFVFSTFIIYLAVFLNRAFGFGNSVLVPDQTFIRKILISSVFLFVPLISFTGGVNAETYFVTCALVPITLIFGPTFYDQIRSIVFENFKVAICLFAIFIFSISALAITNVYFWQVRANQSFALLNWILTYFEVVVLFLAAIAAPLICFVFIRSRYGFRQIILVFSSVLAVINFGFFISSQFRNQIWDKVYGQQLSELSLSETQISIGVWLRSNSSPSDIIATNHYCQQRAVVGERPAVHPEECRQRGLNAWIGAISQRRMLVEAPLVSVYGPGSEFTIKSANLYNLSIDYANDPTVFMRNELKHWGVNWFVIEKSLSKNENWTSAGTIAFENEDYLVLSI